MRRMSSMKYIALIFVAIILNSCTPIMMETAQYNEDSYLEEKQAEEDKKQKEIAEIKAEAVQADFVELNADEYAGLGEKVFASGEVTAITKYGAIGEFDLTTEEGDGYGMYRIINATDVEIEEGDIIKVYGIVYLKDDTGLPTISAYIIEP